MNSVLVIGGGVAGGVLAGRLAAAGRSVTLIDRASGAHHKVCGEFLSHEAQTYLAQAGVDPLALGAVPVRALRLAAGGAPVTIPLPFQGFGLSRSVLDDAILSHAAEQGATIMRGHRVTKLEPGWRATLDDGSTVEGEKAVLATGKHDLKPWSKRRGSQNDLIAFKMHFRLSPSSAAELASHIELLLFPGGYAGLQPIEQGMANLCLVIRERVFARIGGDWAALLQWLDEKVPLLSARLDGAEPQWQRPLAIACLPYGFVARDTAEGLYRLGDQAAVIPSFSGDGMSMALHSAYLAEEFMLDSRSAQDFQARLAAELRGQVRLATALSLFSLNRPVQSLILGLARTLPSAIEAIALRTRVRETRSPLFLGR